jgi:hypothetical protein
MAMGIFPPWAHKRLTVRWNLGYKFILTPPEYRSEGIKTNEKEVPITGSIDFSRLSLQSAMVAVITGGLLVTFKDNKKN